MEVVDQLTCNEYNYWFLQQQRVDGGVNTAMTQARYRLHNGKISCPYKFNRPGQNFVSKSQMVTIGTGQNRTLK